MMWLYFSAAVLLLGAEFSAARGRMHDPRGGWGMQEDSPPGSRAKLASVLAASTRSADALPRVEDRETRAAGFAPASGAPEAAALAATASASALRRVQARNKTSARATAVKIGRTVVLAEAQATRVAAVSLVQAGRTAVAADRYVRRHPWSSVLFAAAAGLAAATVARRNGDANGRRE
jgi:membrane protein